MGIKSLSVPLVCLVLIAMIPAAMAATHTIEGGTGSKSNAPGATVVGEVYSNRNQLDGTSDAYELGVQAIIDQTGTGTSTVSWQTGGVITRTVTLNASTSDPASPSYTGTFSLGSSSVTATVAKTNALGKGHAEARVRTAAQVNGTAEDGASVSGMAEITAQAYYEGLGAGTANASATGNASYNVKEKKYSGFYGAIPMQVWGAVSGTTTSSVKSTAGGSASGLSVIRSGSYAVYAADPLVGNQSVAGMTQGDMNTTGDVLGPEITIPQVTHNEISSTSKIFRNYDGEGTASSFATSALAESGAWDASVNQANPRTKRATESVYSKIMGTTIARSAGYEGGDSADNKGKVVSQVFHNSANQTVAGTTPMYTSINGNNASDNQFRTDATSQRVTPGTLESQKVTSEAYVANGNLTVKARDELPTTTVGRLLSMNIDGAQFGSGAHLLNQATGVMASDAFAGFGANYTIGDMSGATGPARDVLTTTHSFEVNVAGPAMTGDDLDDAGSYGQWGTEAGSTASTQFMSRPVVWNSTAGAFVNSYASMTTAIAGENAVGWLSGDDTRFHMEAEGALEPVVSDPSYLRIPTSNEIWTDMTTDVTEKKINQATSRSDKLTRANAGGAFQPDNIISTS